MMYAATEIFNESRIDGNRQRRIEQILALLPRSAATEGEWKLRRRAIAPELVREIDAYVADVCFADGRNHNTWGRYVKALDDMAGWFLELAHPEFVPEIVRGGYVLKDMPVDADSYIPLHKAMAQLLCGIAAGSERKARLMTNKNWCRENLGLPYAVMIPKNNNLPKEERRKYNDESVRIGERRFYYLNDWDKTAIYALRRKAGELGERLITMERMADWGFAEPGTQAALDAQERAWHRALAEEAAMPRSTIRPMERPRTMPAARKTAQPERARRASGTLPGEVPPGEIRARIETMPRFDENAWLLTQREWCRDHIGIGEPVLYRLTDWMRERRSAQGADRPLRYSGCIVVLDGSEFVVRRMDRHEYGALEIAMEELAG